MPKNTDLYDAMIELRKNKDINEKDKIDALDAILSVDLNEDGSDVDFREAIVNHKEVWEEFEDLMKDPWWTSGYFESKDFLNPEVDTKYDYSFEELQQTAAEERVKLGLAGVEPDVLITILKNNDKECRAYLATKIQVGTKTLGDVPGWNPENEDVLTSEALKNIKTEAVNVLLSKILSNKTIMAKPEMQDPQIFQDLQSGNLPKIKEAAKKIITASGYDLQGLTTDDIVNAFKKKEDLGENVIEQAEELNKEILKKANDVLLKVLSDDNLMATKPGLKDPKLYEDLNSGDKVKIQRAARIIADLAKPGDRQGLTVDNIVNAFTEGEDLAVEVTDKADERKKQRLDELCEAEFRRQLQLFESTLKDEDLLGKTDLLNQEDSKNFLRDLVNEDTPLLKEEDDKEYKERLLGLPEEKRQKIGEEVQQRLCERYLKAKLLKDGIADPTKFKDILKAKNKTEVIEKLKAGIDDHEDLIDHAVTEKNFAEFQVELVKNFIHQMGREPRPSEGDLENLKDLGQIDNLKDFQVKMAQILGTEKVDFIKDKDLPALQKEIRMQHFQLMIENSSRLGIKAHSELTQLFGTLPPAKQKEIVENPKIVSSIMNSPEKDVLKHYLGNVNVDELVKENARNDKFKKIENSAIAQALANYDPPFDLTSRQILEINGVIEDATRDDLTVERTYIDFIENIRNKLGIEKTNFYKAFNIVGNNFDPLTKSTADAIAKQHKNNEKLLEELDEPDGELNKKLVAALIRIEKEEEFSVADITHLKKVFDESKDIEEFFNEWKPKDRDLTDNDTLLKEALMKQLTPALFRAIKTEENQKAFSKAGPLDQAVIIQNTKPVLERLKKDNQTYLEFHTNLVDLGHLEESHSLALQGKPKSEILKKKEQYQDLNKECINIVRKLEDNLREIETHVLPELKSPPTDKKIKEQAEALNKELAAQKKLIEDGIVFYTALANKTAKKLQEIDEALSDKRQIYMPVGVKIYYQDRNKARNMQETVSDPNRIISDRPVPTHDVAIESKGSNDAVYKRVGKPGPNEVICFDITDKVTGRFRVGGTDDAPDIRDIPLDVKGRITYVPTSAPSSGTLQEGQIHKPNAGRIEIVFPKDKDGHLSPKMLEDKNIDTAMLAVMVELLKRLDNNNPPSKKDPIVITGKDPEKAKFVWAACIAYGISPDHIVSRVPGFNPNNELKKGVVAEGSFYNTVFKPKEDKFKTYVDDYKTKVQEKSVAEKETKAVDKKLEQTIQKKQYAEIREDGKKKEKQREQQTVQEEISPRVAGLTRGSSE
ncbi:interaptin [Legionella gratiana]|uniref:Interaptin n=1 Tax=Legionella gratiana TaxID=45066 RepID=A0A378JGL3_9GAMM|nr:hypothetical protein [Legionella gratiana]KTD14051.1 interaptin [Legionella gratiana]STX46078.1 interaptin [Legionella gratiana]